MSSQLARALALLVVSVVAFAATLLAGNRPLLGLDLQGGVSVVYQPTEEASEEALIEATNIIRSRVDALGVAEPEISRQGRTIVVDLPGVEEQQRALELVGQTAELRFRPVLIDFGLLDPGELAPVEPDQPETGTDGDEEGLGLPRFNRQTTDGDDEAPETPAPEQPAGTLTPQEIEITERCLSGVLTPPEADDAGRVVLLPSEDGSILCLGPTLLTGAALESASANLGGGQGWTVNPVFREGADGIDLFNQAAVICNQAQPECPTRRLAIVLDGLVQSAPTINDPVFSRDQIQITGDFTPEEADDLATALRFGALPVQLEAQQTRTISASIGTDVLRSGVIAGVIGVTVVALFLVAYYRLAGLVAITGLVISAMLLWAIVAFLGAQVGLALSLSGIVGLIVAIGVSADSNIVYFENVKDAVASGKRVETSVERAYRNSISTIIKADVVSLIAAFLLYVLTVGAVKGFALYLGLATILDLVIAMMFMRPMLLWLAETGSVQQNPRLLGLPEGAITATLLKERTGRSKRRKTKT